MHERSDTIEGAFYVWTKQEFDEILGDDARIVASHWNVKPQGNVDPEHDIHDELQGKVLRSQNPSDIERPGACQDISRFISRV
jgi:uncharacterized protein YyaL (SSP411 family)